MNYARLPLRHSFLLPCLILLLAGCEVHTPPTAVQPLSSNSRRLLVDGLTSSELLAKWGPPQVVLRNNYVVLTYGQPQSLPAFDEQWVYPTEKGHRLIYLNADKVVLAVEEWADAGSGGSAGSGGIGRGG